MWSFRNGIPPVRQGPQVDIALGCGARDLVRCLDVQAKTQGASADLGDGHGPRFLDGGSVILAFLMSTFGR